MDIPVPHAQLEISTSNVIHNLNYFRSKLSKTTKLLVLVKANSYGHGALPFATILEKEGVDYLAVATPGEGIALRKGGIKLPIIILTTGTEYYPQIIEWRLEPGIPNLSSAAKLAQEVRKSGKKNFPVHIKLDTGMHRLGFMENELNAIIDFINNGEELYVKSIYSHLAASDEPFHDEYTYHQLDLFEKMSNKFINALGYQPMRHILNSAGIERFSQYQYDMVRLGIGIYGISAVDDSALKPCAFFKCPIIQIKELKPGDGTIGYGCHGIIGDKPIKTATLPIGYADGINRHLGRGNISFQINGKMAPTIGNICMDMCMIDITGIDAKVGDIVTIFGEKPSASDIAKVLGTISYEVFTSVSERTRKVTIK